MIYNEISLCRQKKILQEMAVENRVNVARKVSAWSEAHFSEYQGGVSHSPSGFYSFSHKLVFLVSLFFFSKFSSLLLITCTLGRSLPESAFNNVHTFSIFPVRSSEQEQQAERATAHSGLPSRSFPISATGSFPG